MKPACMKESLDPPHLRVVKKKRKKRVPERYFWRRTSLMLDVSPLLSRTIIRQESAVLVLISLIRCISWTIISHRFSVYLNPIRVCLCILGFTKKRKLSSMWEQCAYVCVSSLARGQHPKLRSFSVCRSVIVSAGARVTCLHIIIMHKLDTFSLFCRRRRFFFYIKCTHCMYICFAIASCKHYATQGECVVRVYACVFACTQ